MIINKIIEWINKFIFKDCNIIFQLSKCISEKNMYKYDFETVTNMYNDLINKKKDLTELHNQEYYCNNKKIKGSDKD